MKKLLLLPILILVFCFSALAQQSYEMGKVTDLKGLTKIYIDTDGDMKNKERIVKKIEKNKIPDLMIVEEASDAEIIITFGGRSRSVVAGANSTVNNNNVWTTAARISLDEGAGAVFIAGANGKPRLIFRFQNQQESKWEDTPAVKIAAEFVKYYKQANELK